MSGPGGGKTFSFGLPKPFVYGGVLAPYANLLEPFSLFQEVFRMRLPLRILQT